MLFRISPLWWPLLTVVSPVVAPLLWVRNRQFKRNLERASELNRLRLEQAAPLILPEIDTLDLTVLVEWQAAEGFL